MQNTERKEFDGYVAKLCAGYNAPLGDKPEAYWTAFSKLSLIEFARCVEFALGESGPEKLPTVRGIWDIRRQLKTRLSQRDPEKLLPDQPKWLKLINSMFLKYLSKRRFDEMYIGDINIEDRRRECLSLVEFFEGLEAEGDEEATELQMQVRFGSGDGTRVQDIKR